MRLGIDLACLATARTGAGIYVREILAALKRRASVDLVELMPAAYLNAGGVAAKIHNHLAMLVWSQYQLPRRARRAACQALISPEYYAPRNSSVPRLVVVYDAAFAQRPEEYHPLWRWLFRQVYLPAIRRAEAVVTITETAKAEIVRAYGVRPERIRVVPPACDRERFRARPEAEVSSVLEKYGLLGSPYFLHVGVMEKRKNLSRLVRAFAPVAAKHNQVQLVLAGQPGPKADLNDESAIQAEIAKHSLKERVRLTGFLPAEDLPALYQGAAALVFPTLYEGFGIPVLEAMACGTPVACSRLPVLQEVARNAAMFFDPENESQMTRTLETILEEPDARLELRRAGAARVDDFSWDRSAGAFVELAGSLAQASRASDKTHKAKPKISRE